MRELRVGDRVESPSSDGNMGTVECMVRYRVAGAVELCCVNGCWLTPEHFVKWNNEWVLPQARTRPEFRNLDDGMLYNLMLRPEDGHSVVVDGVEAVTLGHGLQQGVLAHPVWGTAVRPYLEGLPQYPNVVFHQDQFTVEAVLACHPRAPHPQAESPNVGS
eukprot:TRINITY_DN8179_c0_g2_i1.p2 TRINITY_DN8179_c0_g2~~TRINITY_DN8179_c0_g2_i1.p2  ORF type:complete len:161 (+),score=19.39 TRINITY_DN8179_c0_g2_i1:198-680(+)